MAGAPIDPLDSPEAFAAYAQAMRDVLAPGFKTGREGVDGALDNLGLTLEQASALATKKAGHGGAIH